MSFRRSSSVTDVTASNGGRVGATQVVAAAKDTWNSCHQMLEDIQQKMERGVSHAAPLLETASAALSHLAGDDLDRWLPLQLRFAGLLLQAQHYASAGQAYATVEVQIAAHASAQADESRLLPYAESLLGQAAAYYEGKNLLAAQQKIDMYLGLSEFLGDAARLTWARELREQIEDALLYPSARTPLERSLERLGMLNQRIEKATQQEEAVGQRLRTLEEKIAAVKLELPALETQRGETRKRLQQIVQATDEWQAKQAAIIAQISLPIIDAAIADGRFTPADHPLLQTLQAYNPQIVRRIQKALEDGASPAEIGQLTSPFAESEAAFYLSLAQAHISEAREGAELGLLYLLLGWRDYLGRREAQQSHLLALEEGMRQQQAEVEKGRSEVEKMRQEVAARAERIAQTEKELGQRRESIQSQSEEIARRTKDLAAKEGPLDQRIASLHTQEEEVAARARELAVKEAQVERLEAGLLAQLALAHQPPATETPATQASQSDAKASDISSDLFAIVGPQYEQPADDRVEPIIKKNFFPWQAGKLE